MFGYCVWLEIPSLQIYVNFYSLRNWSEHFIPHISIKTRCTLEEALKCHEEIPMNRSNTFTLGKPYQTKTGNFNAIQCDILECPGYHVSIAYRYNIPWTDMEIEACRPPPRVYSGHLSVWNCDGVVSSWQRHLNEHRENNPTSHAYT